MGNAAPRTDDQGSPARSDGGNPRKATASWWSCRGGCGDNRARGLSVAALPTIRLSSAVRTSGANRSGTHTLARRRLGGARCRCRHAGNTAALRGVLRTNISRISIGRAVRCRRVRARRARTGALARWFVGLRNYRRPPVLQRPWFQNRNGLAELPRSVGGGTDCDGVACGDNHGRHRDLYNIRAVARWME